MRRPGLKGRTWGLFGASLAVAWAIVQHFSVIYTPATVKPDLSLAAFTTRLDQMIPVVMEAYDIPGTALAIVKQGRPAWAAAYGYADREAGRPMTTDTYCRVESISKSVTAWGMMKLVQEGKMELDEPAVSYLGGWTFPRSAYTTEQITVRQLLSNSSGLPLGKIGIRYAPGEEMPTLIESLNAEAIPVRPPGTGFSYSNTGYYVLELMMENVTGQDFSGYMTQEILGPLGMPRSSFIFSDTLVPVANGYDLNGNPIPVYVYPGKASGGLFSTVNDIAAFVAAGMQGDNPVLEPSSLDELYRPAARPRGYYGMVFDGYGLGHFIEELPGGEKAVAHGGQGTGWMTHFHAVPSKGEGIVILTNSQRSWPFIAWILGEWAAWSGLQAVGMQQIIQLQKVAWLLIALMVFWGLFQGGRLMGGILQGERKRSFSLQPVPLQRLSLLAGAVLGLAGLIWIVSQEYFFLDSVLPIASVWIYRSLLLVSLVMLFSAACPRTSHGQFVDTH